MQNDHVKIPNTKWQPNQTFRVDKKVCRMVDPRRTGYARPVNCLSWLGRKPQLWGRCSIKYYELRFKENVAIDREANAGIRLDAAEALC